jgi:protein-L-isoaspartate(D-aspartate) O-methyltransferase
MDPDDGRREMVRRLRINGLLHDPRVIEAMGKVPRHIFIPDDIRSLAYIDRPLQIGEGQTISAPHMVAIMAEALDLRPGMKVLEVGGGSGYHAAVMAELVQPNGKVYSVERIEALARTERQNILEAGYADMVEVILGDGSNGLPEHAPYDRISVAAAGPKVPEPLMEQLVDGGSLIVPVGELGQQELIMVRRNGNKFDISEMGAVAFVPLIGQQGYRE